MLFGTDGVRGVANRDLTPELVFELGRIGASVLAGEKRSKVVVGKDTRLSGFLLEAALIAGILSTGTDVVKLGVIPTPAVAYLTRHIGASCGIVISASHNPFYDNGIKFFDKDGFKLSKSLEKEISSLIESKKDAFKRASGKDIGRVFYDEENLNAYLDFLKNSIAIDFCGMHIVVDCANGATFKVAPKLFRDLGADVTAINIHPDGLNINVDSGSTFPKTLQEEVLKKQAHLGLAFDGDGDRLIAVDENGEVLDGDYIMLICARFLKDKALLKQNTLVTTVMSNLGFLKTAEKLNINVVVVPVGDRNVVNELRDRGLNLGGEQSGHIVFFDYNTTGDGLLTALQLLSVIKETGQSLGYLKKDILRFPQALVNVRVKDKSLLENKLVKSTILDVENSLGKEGRVLVRPSGTEPLIRVMVEASSRDICTKYAGKIADAIKKLEYGKV